jgi:hypothetical protein
MCEQRRKWNEIQNMTRDIQVPSNRSGRIPHAAKAEPSFSASASASRSWSARRPLRG